MPPDVFLSYFLPVIQAVAYAHERGVIHRDLKPENVLLTEAGDVKVSDFGLSRAETSEGITTNNLMGTPLYMAPEQFAGQPGTKASDQYSLGIMGYEMLAGRPPFEADSMTELMARRLGEPVPLSQQIKVPLEMDVLISRMMATDPENRFQSLDEVLDILAALIR